MKYSKAKLHWILTDNSDIKKIVFNTIKLEILSVLCPVSKILEESNLLLPKLITIVSTTMKTVKKNEKACWDSWRSFWKCLTFPDA